jgi:hypothetical protein
MCYCKMTYRTVLWSSITFQCVHHIMSCTIAKQITSPVQSCQKVVSIYHLCQVCLNSDCSTSLCHQQLDHFCEEEEKDSNRCRIFVHKGASCILNPQGPLVKGWTPPKFQVSCGLQQAMSLPLSDKTASMESVSKSSSCSMSFSCLKNSDTVESINSQCQKGKHSSSTIIRLLLQGCIQKFPD